MAEIKDVQVVEKNTGEKIQWEQDGYRLSFDDDTMSVNVPKYQMDEPRVLDVCRNRAGDLMLGAQPNGRYVAQIEIPAAEYDEQVEPPEDEGEQPTVTRVKKDLDMGAVVLVLWSVE